MLRLLWRALHKLLVPSSAARRPDAPPSRRLVGSDDDTDPAPATEAAADGEAPVLLPFKPTADPPNRPAA
jgi:hypothetical protein